MVQNQLKPSSLAVLMVTCFESYRSTAYPCASRVWTLGLGSTFNHREKRPVQKGDTCTFPEAMEWKHLDLDAAASIVNTAVSIPLTQKMFDALCSLVYNWGANNFLTSQFLKQLNARSWDSLERNWKSIVKGRIKGTPFKQTIPGLVERRKVEWEVFFEGLKDDEITSYPTSRVH